MESIAPQCDVWTECPRQRTPKVGEVVRVVVDREARLVRVRAVWDARGDGLVTIGGDFADGGAPVLRRVA